jgi:hypothetical protein
MKWKESPVEEVSSWFSKWSQALTSFDVTFTGRDEDVGLAFTGFVTKATEAGARFTDIRDPSSTLRAKIVFDVRLTGVTRFDRLTPPASDPISSSVVESFRFTFRNSSSLVLHQKTSAN